MSRQRDPEPDLGGQVDDDVLVPKGRPDGRGVAYVGHDEVRAQRGQPGAAGGSVIAVDVGSQAVEDGDGVAALAQRPHHGPSDEPRAPGDQHSKDPGLGHGVSPGVMTSVTRWPAALVRAASMTASTCTASRGSTGIPACWSSSDRARSTSR